MSESQKLVALSFTQDELEEVNAAFTAQFHGGEKTLNKFLKAICLRFVRHSLTIGRDDIAHPQIRNQEMKE